MAATVHHSNPARQQAIQQVASTRPAPEPGMVFGAPSRSRKPTTGTPGKRSPAENVDAWNAFEKRARKARP